MRKFAFIAAALAALMVLGTPARAAAEGKYAETAKLFQDAGDSSKYFAKSYGYAVFPTIGKAGLGIGGAHGTGQVYVKGKPVGESKMNQLSFGWQAGAQGYSLIIFFEDERAFKKFTSSDFEFGAGASAVAITAGASAGASTGGTSVGASAGKKDATTSGSFQNGLAMFSIIKGGLMYEAALKGARFKYKPH